MQELRRRVRIGGLDGVKEKRDVAHGAISVRAHGQPTRRERSCVV
jgi:hypothetical protein